jgi:hypothetical protein
MALRNGYSVLSLGGLLARAGGLQVGLVRMGIDRAPRRLALHAARKHRTGGTGGARERETQGGQSELRRTRLGRDRMTLRTGGGLGHQVNRERRLGDGRVVGQRQRGHEIERMTWVCGTGRPIHPGA